MIWTNYHVHTCFCHGVGDPEEYIKEAVSQGIESMGFSSHAPLPYNNPNVINAENLDQYFNDIHLLKLKYKDKIHIFLGLEVDFIPGLLRFNKFRAMGVDYIIGSNHFVGKKNDGKYVRLESGDAISFLESDARVVIENYYHSICQMAQLEKPDIIAHLDLIKKVNSNHIYFDQEEVWYKKVVIETIKCISKTTGIVEVNTSSAAQKSNEWLFPSIWILEKCYELGIKITLSSDAHKPADITAYYETAADIIKDIGYKGIMVLTSNGWESRKLE